MMQVDFLFRLDANSQIGTGHLMRCLALADELTGQGARCGFICQPLPEPLRALLGQHRYFPIQNEDEALLCLANTAHRVLIIDHYELDAHFEHRARQFSRYLLVIDDLADRQHEADWLLDQGPLRNPQDYQSKVNPECQLLLGAAYALLRPTFLDHRKAASRAFQRGLISFGGADPVHACWRCLQSLSATPWLARCEWTVLAGAANPDWDRLQAWIQQQATPIHLLRHTDQVAALLAEQDFAIGAAGGMMWERCCIGLPTLAIPIVDNQIFNDRVIQYFQLGERLPLADLQQANKLDQALQQLQKKAEFYRKNSQRLVDGRGLARLASLLRNAT